MHSLTVVKQEREYRKLFIAGLVNGIGDRFSQVAVLGLLLSITGSGMAIGIVFAVRLIPYLIFAPIGGALADRFSKKSVMIAADLFRVVFALSPLLVRDASDLWIVYTSSFLLSAGEAIYSPARMSSIPLLVNKNRLLSVNGLEEAMTGFVLIMGSVTGGVVAAVFGPELSFVLNSISFLLSAVILMGVRMLQTATVEEASYEQEAAQPVRRSSLAGERYSLIRLLKDSSYLRALLVLFAFWPIGDGIFNILLSVYAIDVFHAGDMGIGLMYGALGIGLVLGAGLTGKFRQRLRMAAVCAVVGQGMLSMAISQSGVLLVAIMLLILTAMCAAIGNACNSTLLMNAVPEPVQGRFFGMLSTMQNTVMGLTMLSAGFALDGLDPRTLGLIGGTCFVAVGLAFAAFRTKKRSTSKLW